MRARELVLPLIAVAGIGCGADREPSRRVVPNVAGINAAAAECVIKKSGLSWRYADGSRGANAIGAACSGRYPAPENICRQSPRAGSRVPAGALVRLRLWSPGVNKRSDCDNPPATNDDPRGAIQNVSSSFFRQAKIRNGRASCRLLTDTERARLDAGAGGCASVLDRELSPRIRHGRETVPIVLSYDGQHGRARVRLLPESANGSPPVIALVRQGPHWLIADTGIRLG